MRLSLGPLCAMWLTAHPRCRVSLSSDARVERRTVAEVIADLDTVPVFAIATNGKLYSTEAGCMVYTQLVDATRVIAQLQATYPAEAFALEPLSLGTVLSESGMLVKRASPPKVMLVPSADAKRAARELSTKTDAAELEEGVSTVPKRWLPLRQVPIFHIGALAGRGTAEEAESKIWPLFFRLCDIDRMWEELGEGKPPPVQAMDLAVLVAHLREPFSAPGTPMLCAPLDGLDFVAERDRSALKALEQGELSEDS